jgi:limonene-1,2-epoxide hydrolase
MERTYDIFEVRDGSPIWQKAVTGHDAAIAFARKFAENTTNEIRVMHLASNALIVHFNSHDSPSN